MSFNEAHIGRITCGCVCTDDPVPYEPLLAHASADGVVGELKVPTPNPHLLVLELLAGRVWVTRLAEIRWIRHATVLSCNKKECFLTKLGACCWK